LADLWHAPHSKQAIGTATTGSSEAIQLGGLAMKRIWQAKRKAAGKSIHEPGPNIVMGANAQVALEKFARYFEVECRLVPISVESKYHLDPKKAMEVSSHIDCVAPANLCPSNDCSMSMRIRSEFLSSWAVRIMFAVYEQKLRTS
jgi:hypothetical protein